MRRIGNSSLRGDESQFDAWFNSLSKEEQKAHEEKIKREAIEASNRPHPTVKRGEVAGICDKCNGAVMVGELETPTRIHTGCGGTVIPISRDVAKR